MNSSKETDRFDVYAEDGKKFEVIEFTEIIKAGDLSDPNKTIPGLKSLQTSNGMKVNFKDTDVYEIIELGLICKRTKI